MDVHATNPDQDEDEDSSENEESDGDDEPDDDTHAWLEQVGLGRYEAMLSGKGFLRLSDFEQMQDPDIQELARECITAGMPPAHAKYMMLKVVELRAYGFGNY